MKCTVCRGPAVIDLRRHNSNFCAEHFLKFCRDQVSRTIDEFDMIDEDDDVLVAVSGGKDSLALWDILSELGYRTTGLYIGLGIDDYSDDSLASARAFSESHGAELVEVDLTERYGFGIPGGSKAARRTPCSACGLSKRHVFDDVALERSAGVLVTGHNLDDEAAVLFGNVMHWHTEYLARQFPVLPARHGFPKKAKPLVRLGEREMAAYCVLRGIDYQVDECPMSKGNKHLGYKEILNDMECRSPGSKADFYLGFLRRASAMFVADASSDAAPAACERCGSPTTAEVCAFCRLVERATSVQPTRDRVDISPRRAQRVGDADGDVLSS